MHARTDQKQKRGPFEYNNSYSNPTETDRKEGIEELLNTIDSFNPIFINWNFKLENPSKNKYKISRTTKINLSNKQIHKRSLKKSPPQTILKQSSNIQTPSPLKKGREESQNIENKRKISHNTNAHKQAGKQAKNRSGEKFS